MKLGPGVGCVLIRSSCNNKNTRGYFWVASKEQKFISHVSGGWVSSETPLPGSEMATFSLCPHLVDEFWNLFYKGTNLIHEAPHSESHHLPKDHLLMLPHWGLGGQHMNWGGTQTFSVQQAGTHI